MPKPLPTPPRSALPPLGGPGGAARVSGPRLVELADRRWRRALRAGALLAVLFHLGIFLAFRTTRVLPSPFAAAGPPMGDYRAAAGGGGMEMVQVRVQEARAPVEQAVPEPVPVPDVEVEIEPVPQPEPEPVRAPELSLALPGQGTQGEGAGRGEATGAGIAQGSGSGGGGTEMEGASRLVAPVPRGMILPPAERPRSVRGREVTVWVFVNESGRVVPDSTRLEPPTPDAAYNRRLVQSAAEWVFEPARRTGRPVAAWYPYQIEL